MTTKVTVDSRPGEDAVYSHLVELLDGCASISLSRGLLEVGDVCVEGPGKVVVLERKTFSDLCASLRDGRYANQKARLLAEQERRAITFAYLVEGCPPPETGTTHKTPNAHAYAALTKMALRDGIASLWSASAADTARRVAYIARTCQANGFDAETKLREHAAGGYSAFVKHTSKRKNCDDNQFTVMLTTIPGVSARLATAVAQHFPTAAALVHAYDAALGRGEEAGALLTDVQVGNGKRLGPSLSAKICKVFSA